MRMLRTDTSRLAGIALTGLLALLAAPGCDREKAKQVVNAAGAQASEAFDESQILAHADQFLRAVEARNLDSLKQLCSVSGGGDYAEIMGCYYSAFAIEHEQGVDAARQFLAAEVAKGDNSPAKAKALTAMGNYFDAKGTLRAREVAAAVLIIGLEAKVPHQGAILGTLISQKLHLIDLNQQNDEDGTK